MYENVIHEMQERILHNASELDKLGVEVVHGVKEAVSPLFDAIKEDDEDE